MCRYFLLSLLLSFALTTIPGQVDAAIQFSFFDEKMNFLLSGYGTLGAVTTDARLQAFRREITSTDSVTKGEIKLTPDSLLGVQINGRFGSNWESTIQLRFRNAESHQDGLSHYLRFAFLRYRLDNGVEVRLGKVPVESLIFSETRDVGYAYLGVRSSSVVYGNLMLDYYTGLELSYRAFTLGGEAIVRLGGGQFETDYTPAQDIVAKLDFDSMWSLSANYTRQQHNVRAGYLWGEVSKYSYPRGFDQLTQRFIKELPYLDPLLVASLSGLTQTGSRIKQYTLGYVYDNARWLVQSELAHILYSYHANYEYTLGYLSVGYRIKTLTPFVSVSRIYSSSTENIKGYVLATPEGAAARIGDLFQYTLGTADQSSLTLGLRWDFRPNMSLKLQWDHSKVGRYGGYLWLPEKNVLLQDERINVWSVSLDFIY